MNRRREVRLRTSPLYAPEIQVGADGTRPGGGPRLSILMPPGSYTVRLNAGGKQLTQKLEVRKDPNSARHRRRHPRTVQGADRAPARARRRGGAVEPDRDRARADPRARSRDGQRRDHEAGARARTEARRAAAEPAGAAHDRPRPGRRALRRPAAEQDRISRERPRERRTSGRPISSSKCRRCCETTYGSNRRRWPRWWARKSRRSTS